MAAVFIIRKSSGDSVGAINDRPYIPDITLYNQNIIFKNTKSRSVLLRLFC